MRAVFSLVDGLLLSGFLLLAINRTSTNERVS
jgi:hypothetical protein